MVGEKLWPLLWGKSHSNGNRCQEERRGGDDDRTDTINFLVKATTAVSSRFDHS